MIARRFGLDHHRLARRVQPGQKNGRFHLRRWHRHPVAHRQGLACTDQRHRQPPARAPHRLRPEQRQRIGDPRHRAPVQAGIPGKGHGDRTGRHRPHDQPHAGARIAAIDHATRLAKTTDANAMDPPFAIAQPLDFGPKGLHRAPGIQHVLSLQKPRNPGLAHSHRPQDQTAMRDRLVARHLRHTLQRTRGARSHRNWGTVAGHGINPVRKTSRC